MAQSAQERKWVHTSLTVANLGEAIDFYRRLLGYELLFVSEGITELAASIVGIRGVSADVAQLRLASSGHVLELIEWHDVSPSDSEHGPTNLGQAHIAFAVDDFDGTLARALELGATQLGDITVFPEGRSVYLRDRNGTFIELEEGAG